MKKSKRINGVFNFIESLRFNKKMDEIHNEVKMKAHELLSHPESSIISEGVDPRNEHRYIYLLSFRNHFISVYYYPADYYYTFEKV